MTVCELIQTLLRSNVNLNQNILIEGDWDIRLKICNKHISLTVSDDEDTEHKYLQLEVNK